jgi:hypothetical protein
MKLLLKLLPVILVAGCMEGNMQGVMTDGTPINMLYEQGMSSDTYTTTIDGETFKGKAVMVDKSVTFTNAFGTAFATSGTSSASSFGSGFGIGSTSGGKVKAVLLGNKGSYLNCLMQYADASGFTSAGGVGECMHSDGRTVMITW